MRVALGLAGLASLALAGAFAGPADERLTDHVVEHGLLVLVAAPLLVAAAPVRLALAVLPSGGRRAVGQALHARGVRVLAHPAVCLAAFVAVTAAAYVPAVTDATLRHPLLHGLAHAALLWSALLLWSPVVAVDPLPRRIGAIGRVAVALVAMTAMAVVGAILATARSPLYAAYPDLADQHAAGAIMWMVGMVAALPVLLGSAWHALQAEERRQRARELHGVGR
jgi:cytochrome c oxidase assembly factor CtaG